MARISPARRPQQINRRGLARSFQITNIFPRLSVWENIRCAALWSLQYKYSFWHAIDSLTDVRDRAEHILHEIGPDRSGAEGCRRAC